MLVVVPTPDVAERAFADLLYYLGEDEPRDVALLRSRDEAAGRNRESLGTQRAHDAAGRSCRRAAPARARAGRRAASVRDAARALRPFAHSNCASVTNPAGNACKSSSLHPRVHAHRRRERGRRVRGARRHHRSLRGQRRRSGAYRVLRRLDREHSPLRSRDAAQRRRARAHCDRAVERDSARPAFIARAFSIVSTGRRPYAHRWPPTSRAASDVPASWLPLALRRARDAARFLACRRDDRARRAEHARNDRTWARRRTLARAERAYSPASSRASFR